MQRRCTPEGKKRVYATEMAAWRARKPGKPYQCDHGPHWHITTQPRGIELRGHN